MMTDQRPRRDGDSAAPERRGRQSAVRPGRKRFYESDIDVDEMGPVDYLVVEFPAGKSNFTGELAAELASLVNAGTVRLLDLLIAAQGRRRHH